MASQRSTIDTLVEQAAGAVSARKMFGEYALYCGAKLVALVCDDQLFLKPTAAGRTHLGAAQQGTVGEASPYPGAKPCLVIPGDLWEDGDWLATLFRVSAAELPPPKAKRRRGP